MFDKLLKIVLYFFLWLHNFAYRAINTLVVRVNNGVHPKHRIMNYAAFFLDNVNSGDTVIDIGCGKGETAFVVAQKASAVVGLDQKLSNIEKASYRYAHPNLNFICGDALNYDFGQKFDKIVLSNVLEHIEKREEFLRSLRRVSDTILLRVPMITRDWLAVYKKELGLEYRLDRTHFIEYDLETLSAECQSGGWEIVNFSIQFGEFWGILKSNDNL